MHTPSPASGAWAARSTNLAAEDAGDNVADAHGGAKYERLVELKHRWDPDNVLRFYKNIAPTIAWEGPPR